MKNILNLYKPVGLSPLQLVYLFKKTHEEYKDSVLGYAGRLDPMAEGVLLVLVGEENKKRKTYERLQKEYVFEVLFGVETDSYDVLGICKRGKNKHLFSEVIEKWLKTYVGKKMQVYPPYSAVRVNGKPLFYWAREGKIQDIKIPQKEIEIYTLDLLDMETMPASQVKEIIYDKTQKVDGVFRQKEIQMMWETFFRTYDTDFQVATIRMTCSSGTYVRSLAHTVGQDMETGALAFSIKRTKVGAHSSEDSQRISL